MAFIARGLLLATLIAGSGVHVLAQRGVPHGFMPVPGPTGLRGLSPGGNPIAVPRGVPVPLGLRSPVAGYTGIRPGAFRFHGDYRKVPSSFFISPFYFPFLDYGAAPFGGVPFDPPEDPDAQAAMMAENAVGEQLQRLTADVEQLKNAQSQQLPPVPAQVQQQEPSPPQIPITLVLRDGHQLQIQNYAIVNQTFWDFSNQPTRRIPISNIDIPASIRATEASGAEFPQLGSSQ